MMTSKPLLFLVALGLFAGACTSGGDENACGPEGASVARVWNEQALDAIRRDFPAPTVHARNLYHLSALAYDLWVASGGDGRPVLVDARPGISSLLLGPTPADDDELVDAMAHGAHHILTHRYANATGAEETLASFDAAIGCYGSADSDPARFGIGVAEALIELTIEDGSRETSGYTDLS